MENSTINKKILLIVLGVLTGSLWIYIFVSIPDMLVSEMSKLEKLGTMFMILIPFFSVGLIIAGCYINDANSVESEVEDG